MGFKLGRFVGRISFWMSWPLLYIYFRYTPVRTRVLVQSDDDILLVRGWLGTGEYELPGGGSHFKEALPKAALRELREELALILREEDLKPLCRGTYRQHGLTIRYITYAARITGKRRLRLRRLEIAEAAWVPKKEIVYLRVKPDVTDSLKVLDTI